MRRPIVILSLVLALVALPNCGKKESAEEKAAKQIAAAMDQVGKQMSGVKDASEKMKAASEKMHGGEIVTADRETLVAALPRVEGWEMKNPRYQKTSFGGIEIANVDVDYLGAGDQEVEVSLTDAATASAMLAPLKMIFNMKMVNEDDDSYEKVSTVNGIPVIEKYDKQDKDAELTLILKDRYILNLKARGEGSLDRLKIFVTAFNIAELK